MKKVFLILATLNFIGFTSKAQIQQGLRTSNYGGINSLQLNPSSFHYGTLKWDINIVAGGLFFENEYLFINNTNFIELLNHDGPFIQRKTSTDPLNQQDDPQALYYDFFDPNKDMNNSANAFAGLPSIAFRLDKHSFGIFTNFRMAIGLNKLDNDLDYFSIDRWVEGKIKSIDPIKIAGMQWAEIGFNAATKLKETKFNKWYVGVNIKYLRGINGFYLNSNSNSTATEINDTISFSGGPYEYGLASGTMNGESPFQGNGHGAGLDIGLTFIKKHINKSKPYLWRLGVSIVDLGFVHFNSNAQDHSLSASDLYSLDKASFTGINNPINLFQIISEQSTGNPNQTLVDDNFNIYTPAMISIQFDYALKRNWFFSSQINRRMNLSAKMVDRENLIAGSFRYEKMNWEIGIPVSLVEDHHLRAGLWARFYFLTLGSDHIRSLFIDDPQFTGSDVYFAIKLNPFNSKPRSGVERCNFN